MVFDPRMKSSIVLHHSRGTQGQETTPGATPETALLCAYVTKHLFICHASPACSLPTFLGSLSSLNPTNFVCLKCSTSVHSRNSICATSLGLTQTHFSISSA